MVVPVGRGPRVSRAAAGRGRTTGRCSARGSDAPVPVRVVAKLRVEKAGRGGKAVTVVYDLPRNAGFLKELSRELKQACGAGGTVQDVQRHRDPGRPARSDPGPSSEEGLRRQGRPSAMSFSSDDDLTVLPAPGPGSLGDGTDAGAPLLQPWGGPRPVPGIARLLGRGGGLGRRWTSRAPEQGRRVALKVLGQRMAGPRRARFLREGQLAASISHPNTVYVFGSEEIAGTPDRDGTRPGRHAQGRVARRADGAGGGRGRVLQVVAGLDAALACGILHRDVKPWNCFVDPTAGEVGDFGLSIPVLAPEVPQPAGRPPPGHAAVCGARSNCAAAAGCPRRHLRGWRDAATTS